MIEKCVIVFTFHHKLVKIALKKEAHSEIFKPIIYRG